MDKNRLNEGNMYLNLLIVCENSRFRIISREETYTVINFSKYCHTDRELSITTKTL